MGARHVYTTIKYAQLLIPTKKQWLKSAGAVSRKGEIVAPTAWNAHGFSAYGAILCAVECVIGSAAGMVGDDLVAYRELRSRLMRDVFKLVQVSLNKRGYTNKDTGIWLFNNSCKFDELQSFFDECLAAAKMEVEGQTTFSRKLAA